MLTKLQFGDLLKRNFMWPGWDWHLATTSNGLEGISNVYATGVVEIIIDYLYQRYVYAQNITNIIDVDRADSEKEVVGLKATGNTLIPGDRIRVYNTYRYDGEYVVLDNSDNTDYIYIQNSFTPEIIGNSSYYTLVSPDYYTESSPYALDPGDQVINVAVPQDPTFLPLLGLDHGYVYDDSLTIAQNRILEKRSIDFYKVKGTLTSIDIVMRLLGYDCSIVEPHKLMMKYGISKYNSKDHYQDWAYYHDGVFEIITDGVSLNSYKRAIRTKVQLAGTRLVGRANMNLGLIPAVGEILNYYSDSFFSEAIVKAFKAGNIYDTITDPSQRTRSGNVELWGLYLDLAVDLGEVTSFRRVWDSNIFSFEDLARAITVINPASRYSVIKGAYSGDVTTITGYDSPYDETSPLDIQLDFNVISKSERPAIRSEYCNKRSGAYSRSGLDGTSWTYKPCFIIDSNEPVSMNIPEHCENTIEVSTNVDGGFISYSSHSGNILDVNDSYSGVRSIFGIELALGIRPTTMQDWVDKVYWSWDDTAVLGDFTDQNAKLQGTHMDIVNEPPLVSYYSLTETYDRDHSMSGYLQCYDIEIFASN